MCSSGLILGATVDVEIGMAGSEVEDSSVCTLHSAPVVRSRVFLYILSTYSNSVLSEDRPQHEDSIQNSS